MQPKIVITKENDDEIEVDKFRQHLAKCHKFEKESTLIKLPAKGTKMSFNNHKNKLERPFIAYFDLESSLRKTYDEEKIANHEANSACIYLVCTFDPSRNILWHYVGC